ncbi:MAG: hypothetical protein V2A53_09805 [bacterium]
MRKRMLLVGGMIILSPLVLAQERVSLFPRQILVNEKLVMALEKLSEPIKIEVSGLVMGIDPAGSITISSGENWIDIKIDPKGTVSSSHNLSPSGNIGKEITGIGKLSLKGDLSLGRIELILKEGMDLNKHDLLILPLIWKGIKKAGRTTVKEKESIEIRR